MAMLVVLAAAGAAHAQNKDVQYTTVVRVHFKDVCRIHGTPKFVVAGKDAEPAAIENGQDRDWTVTVTPAIPMNGSIVSVRLGGSRTACRRSTEYWGGRAEAYVEFDCDENPSWDVKIEPVEHQPFKYLRYLPPLQKADRPCLEWEPETPGTRTIYDVRLPDETLNIELAPGFWMHVNAVSIFEAPKERVSAKQSLDRNQLIDAIKNSTFLEATCPNAIDVIRKNRRLEKLKGINFTRTGYWDANQR